MLENDFNLVQERLNSIHERHSFEQTEENPYQNLNKIQGKCKHMWPNDTDAIYITVHKKRKCAICGKEF